MSDVVSDGKINQLGAVIHELEMSNELVLKLRNTGARRVRGAL